jgi:hypothetical protein
MVEHRFGVETASLLLALSWGMSFWGIMEGFTDDVVGLGTQIGYQRLGLWNVRPWYWYWSGGLIRMAWSVRISSLNGLIMTVMTF